MKRYRRFKLSPEAANDIREIWSYIAEDSVRAARKVRLSLFDACQRLAENPRIGHVRDDLTDQPVLFWPVGSYLIIYDPASKPLSIVRVVHGARDVPGLF
ncbi:MAG: type II toxin-antitoxin system RelE/ParE family toxin [Bryobacteraceae bacterium]